MLIKISQTIQQIQIIIKQKCIPDRPKSVGDFVILRCRRVCVSQPVRPIRYNIFRKFKKEQKR